MQLLQVDTFYNTILQKDTCSVKIKNSSVKRVELTVWEARPRAKSRGRPAATPPSAKASIAKNIYAGPLPLNI